MTINMKNETGIIMRFINFLIEARRNADHPSQDKLVGINPILKYEKDADNIYMSFTRIENKIGINPKSNWGTPNGIYTYKLSDFISKMKQLNSYGVGVVPFAGGFPVIWLLKPTKNILVLNTYNDFSTDYKKLEGLIKQLTERLKIKHDYDLLDHVNAINMWANGSYKDGTKLWNVTQNLARGLTHINKGTSNYSNTWSKIFRKDLGYDIIEDRGEGIIWSSEPFQTVFLTPDSYKIVEKIHNKAQVKRIPDERLRGHELIDRINKVGLRVVLHDDYMNSLKQLMFDLAKTKSAKMARRLSSENDKLLYDIILKTDRWGARDVIPLYVKFKRNHIPELFNKIKDDPSTAINYAIQLEKRVPEVEEMLNYLESDYLKNQYYDFFKIKRPVNNKNRELDLGDISF